MIIFGSEFCQLDFYSRILILSTRHFWKALSSFITRTRTDTKYFQNPAEFYQT